MIEYLSFKVKNGKTFRDVSVPLKDLGVVAIQGKNGVGKSSLWDLLQTMHFTKSPSGHKKDELVRNVKDSEWELEFNKDDKHYRINYARKKHGTDKKPKWKFHIYEDGENITSHNQQTEVPKQLLNIIDYTQDEYEGSVHLTQSGQHILIKGKPKDRKEYISNFFGLDTRYDHVLEHAKKELKDVKDEIDRISSFYHSMQTLEIEIKDIVVPDIEVINSKMVEPNQKLSEISNFIQSLNNELTQAQEYEKFSPLALSADDPHGKLNALQEEAGKINAQLEQHTLVSDYNRKAKEANAKYESLKQQLDSLPPVTIEGDLNQLNAESADLRNKLSQWEKDGPLRTEFDSLPETEFIDLVEANNNIQNLRISISKSKDKLQAIKNGECPTCGHQHTDGEIGNVDSLLAQNEASLLDWENYFKQANESNTIHERRKYLEERLSNSVLYTEEMETRRIQLETNLPTYNTKSQIERDLSGLSYQELMEEADISQLRVRLLEVQTEQQSLQVVVEALSKCPPKPQRTSEEISSLLTTYQTELSSLHSAIDALKAELAVAEEKKYRRDRLQTQIDGLKKELSQLEGLKRKEFLWSKMVEAYGPKGLRLIQLNRVMDLLMERLPFFTNLLFDDKTMEFYHKCDSGNISIMWRRRDEEGEYDIDVSQMSGGESKKLAVALVLALASCVPSKKRANILILDEIDGQLDDDGKNMFSSQLLPALKGDYNSVFVISHSKDVQQADVYDQVWYYTKPERSHYTLIDRRII